MCDRERILHILSNLVDNAIKVTAAGGTITLSLSLSLSLSLALVQNVLLFSVSDTGSGITEEELARVFERYRRARGPASPEPVEGSPSPAVERSVHFPLPIMSTSTDLKDAMEQVREILVGALQRELERRITRVEAHIGTRATELQQDARKRIEVVESHLTQETTALAARVEAEAVDTKDALRALGRDHREMTSALEQRVVKLEETIVKQQHALRQQMLEQAKSFLDELQHVRAELVETLDRELGAFENELVEEEPSRESRTSHQTDERPSA